MQFITVKGAKEHNLKNIDIKIPKQKIVVITGRSGSGKSSLAFDTVYREGQRRYMESLSTYARQFLEQSHKPNVEHIEGLSPTIAIEQRKANANPRSTVATVTEIYDYLRVLFARVGDAHCPNCDVPLARQTVQSIVDAILALPENSRLYLLAPVVRGKKGKHEEIIRSAQREGFSRLRVNGKVLEVDDVPTLHKTKRHTIEIVIDRLKIRADIKKRLTQSVELALTVGQGMLEAAIEDPKAGEWESHLFSEHFACVKCHFSMTELEPRLFSFNSPYGACETCHGLGHRMELDASKIVPNEELPLRNGAVDAWRHEGKRMTIHYSYMLKDFADAYGISLDDPYSKLTKRLKNILLYGSAQDESAKSSFEFEGVIPNLHRRFATTDSDFVKQRIHRFMSKQHCDGCQGHKLRPEALSVRISEHNIHDMTQLSIGRAVAVFEKLKFNKEKKKIAADVVAEIVSRLKFMQDVGLNYLNLNRTSDSLSGGEAQRIRLATQVGSKLTGVIYVLDEPTIGLHPRDNHRLISTLTQLRDLDNTLIVVEHDRDVIEAADYIIDIGPGSGTRGGQVVAMGTPKQIMKNKKSVTGPYLRDEEIIKTPEERRAVDKKRLIKVSKASSNNLVNVDVSFPVGLLTCVAGVSGSGKSSLVNQTLAKSLLNHFSRGKTEFKNCKKITGLDAIDKLILITQSPIGKTSRSNPATYVGIFDEVRKLFSLLPEAKVRGYKPGRFSFNVKGGRCESCQGMGTKKIEMHFLPDVNVTCQDCAGQRFNRETLEIKYKSHSIADILKLEIFEAFDVFKSHPIIHQKIQLLLDVGLGYVTLGQSSTTLSGGEAQRIKLAYELSKRGTGKTLYILDEPTTGLHFAEIEKLMVILNRLVEMGNTIIVIEHNLDVIKCADYVLDMGPEGGEGGGRIVAQGTPEDIVKNKKSVTGEFLKPLLASRT